MRDYIRERITIDAQRALALAKHQQEIVHKGLRGRFRELIAQTLLKPWLPPGIECGTGTIINGITDEVRESTQDDLIIYDKNIMPPALLDQDSSEGVYLNNSVLMRIEVKSRVCANDIKSFVASSRDFLRIGLVTGPDATNDLNGTLCFRSTLLAFDSDTKCPIREIARYRKELDPHGPEIASIFLAVGNGLFMLREVKRARKWCRMRCECGAQQLAAFTAIISSTAVRARMERSGVNPANSLQAGIGLLFPAEDEWEVLE